MAAAYLALVATTAVLAGRSLTGPEEALAMAPALFAAGVGQGFVSAPLLGAVLATVRPEEAGAGSGIVLTVIQLASSLGVAVLGAFFVALLGADPQDTAAHLTARDFTGALQSCSWLLTGLAAATGFLVRRLPGRPPEHR